MATTRDQKEHDDQLAEDRREWELAHLPPEVMGAVWTGPKDKETP